MSVRTIPLNRRSLTGRVAVAENQFVPFESSLERDFLYLMEFDQRVGEVVSQPMRIRYLDDEGKVRFYTPDYLVEYDQSDASDSSTWVYEIKHVSDLRKEWTELRPRFGAAIRFGRLHGWKFKILTERQIRGQYLENVKFLRHYLRRELLDDWRTVYEVARRLGPASLDEILGSLISTPETRPQFTFIVWQLVARGFLITDLTVPLTRRRLLRAE